MNQKHLIILCVALSLIGLAITGYRWLVLEFPLTPRDQSPTWRVEVRAAFTAHNAPVKATLMLPKSTLEHTLFDEHFVSSGYGFATASDDENRRAIFTRRSASGEQVLWYRAVVHKTLSRETPPAVAPPDAPKGIGLSGADRAAAEDLVRDLDAQSADNRSFVRLLFARLNDPPANGKAALLLKSERGANKATKVAVKVLKLARIPARAVNGLALTPDRRDARLTSWIEIYDDNRWVPFDPAHGRFKSPENHLGWWRGTESLFRVAGGSNVKTNVAVREMFVYSLQSAVNKARVKNDPLVTLSVFGLPLQTQEVYRLLLTVPVGIFLLVILRNVVGLRTFGTFMPVLIALAFRQTELLWGFVLFTSVLAVGLLIRFYLEQLKLLLVPRLACVVIVVVLVMTVISVISHQLGFDRGLSVALFPIVILAMTIERMTVVWDERGAKEAIIQASGSFAVAVLCYLLMTMEIVKHWVFVFPEALLVVLAATLALGRYSGYRLVELPRFKVLAGKD